MADERVDLWISYWRRFGSSALNNASWRQLISGSLTVLVWRISLSAYVDSVGIRHTGGEYAAKAEESYAQRYPHRFLVSYRRQIIPLGASP